MYRSILYIYRHKNGKAHLKKLKYTLQSHFALFKCVFIKLAFAIRCKSRLFYFQAVYTVKIVQNVNL
jgi:hypothetical protein